MGILAILALFHRTADLALSCLFEFERKFSMEFGKGSGHGILGWIMCVYGIRGRWIGGWDTVRWNDTLYFEIELDFFMSTRTDASELGLAA